MKKLCVAMSLLTVGRLMSNSKSCEPFLRANQELLNTTKILNTTIKETTQKVVTKTQHLSARATARVLSNYKQVLKKLSEKVKITSNLAQKNLKKLQTAGCVKKADSEGENYV